MRAAEVARRPLRSLPTSSDTRLAAAIWYQPGLAGYTRATMDDTSNTRGGLPWLLLRGAQRLTVVALVALVKDTQEHGLAKCEAASQRSRLKGQTW